MATHWTAAVPREHKIERSSLITDWDCLYERSEALLKKSDNLFEKSIRNTVVKEVLQEAYPDIDKQYSPRNLPLAGVRNGEFVTWTGSNTILGEDLVKIIKSGDNSKDAKISLKVSN